MTPLPPKNPSVMPASPHARFILQDGDQEYVCTDRDTALAIQAAMSSMLGRTPNIRPLSHS